MATDADIDAVLAVLEQGCGGLCLMLNAAPAALDTALAACDAVRARFVPEFAAALIRRLVLRPRSLFRHTHHAHLVANVLAVRLLEAQPLLDRLLPMRTACEADFAPERYPSFVQLVFIDLYAHARVALGEPAFQAQLAAQFDAVRAAIAAQPLLEAGVQLLCPRYPLMKFSPIYANEAALAALARLRPQDLDSPLPKSVWAFVHEMQTCTMFARRMRAQLHALFRTHLTQRKPELVLRVYQRACVLFEPADAEKMIFTVTIGDAGALAFVEQYAARELTAYMSGARELAPAALECILRAFTPGHITQSWLTLLRALNTAAGMRRMPDNPAVRRIRLLGGLIARFRPAVHDLYEIWQHSKERGNDLFARAAQTAHGRVTTRVEQITPDNFRALTRTTGTAHSDTLAFTRCFEAMAQVDMPGRPRYFWQFHTDNVLIEVATGGAPALVRCTSVQAAIVERLVNAYPRALRPADFVDLPAAIVADALAAICESELGAAAGPDGAVALRDALPSVKQTGGYVCLNGDVPSGRAVVDREKLRCAIDSVAKRLQGGTRHALIEATKKEYTRRHTQPVPSVDDIKRGIEELALRSLLSIENDRGDWVYAP